MKPAETPPTPPFCDGLPHDIFATTSRSIARRRWSMSVRCHRVARVAHARCERNHPRRRNGTNFDEDGRRTADVAVGQSDIYGDSNRYETGPDDPR
jgi:hypothetical protein